MAAGADFVKTSTASSSVVTLPVTLVMLEAIRDVHEETGRRGHEARRRHQAGQAGRAIPRPVARDARPRVADPDLYRLGASTLLNDVLMQIRKEKTGRYQSPDYFTVD